MSIKEVIEQLKTLVEHCDKMQEYNNHEPWCDDVRALNIAIDILKKYDYALNIREENARPQGNWILCDDTYFSKCSICGDIWLNEECNNYCPNCGAYMRSDNNEN